MSRKTIFFTILTLASIASAGYWYYRWSQRPVSRIVRQEVAVQVKGNITTTDIPIAELPRPLETNEVSESIRGRISRIPADPKNPGAKKMTVLVLNGENIVLSNITYVHSLEYLYAGADVVLRGSWKRPALIFGVSYRVFWIEDYESAPSQEDNS